MTLKDIEVADIPLTKTIKNSTEILFVFPEIYSINDKKYIKNCALKIENWKDLQALAIISYSSSSFDKKELQENELENFDLIQEITLDGNFLTLKGYSRDSNNWLEYSFLDCNYEILNPYLE